MSALHITNGDIAATTLREFVSGPVTMSADVLHEGPAPAVDDDHWYELRARFLADGTPRMEELARELAALDSTLDSASAYEEVVLWFEHDLFDQLNLIRTLERLGRNNPRHEHVALICIDRFPGVERFIGLGQLNALQLSTLIERKQVVSELHFAVATRAWEAFRSPDPRSLLRIASAGTEPLPFLAPALKRLLAEYPSTFDGLSRTARHLLESLETGPSDAEDVFRRAQALEEHPFMGDSTFFRIARDLAAARAPLVQIDCDGDATDLRGRTISLTEAGRDVLAGRRDAVALNGIDEWRGGVHLYGLDSSPWRWDVSPGTLVSLV